MILDNMGKLQVKEMAPACGVLSCDFCVDEVDLECEAGTIRAGVTAEGKIHHVFTMTIPVDRAAVALARQEAVFAEP